MAWLISLSFLGFHVQILAHHGPGLTEGKRNKLVGMMLTRKTKEGSNMSKKVNMSALGRLLESC